MYTLREVKTLYDTIHSLLAAGKYDELLALDSQKYWDESHVLEVLGFTNSTAFSIPPEGEFFVAWLIPGAGFEAYLWAEGKPTDTIIKVRFSDTNVFNFWISQFE